MRDKQRPFIAVVWTYRTRTLMIDWFHTEEEARAFARGKSVGASAPVHVLWGDKVFDPVEPPPTRRTKRTR